MPLSLVLYVDIIKCGTDYTDYTSTQRRGQWSFYCPRLNVDRKNIIEMFVTLVLFSLEAGKTTFLMSVKTECDQTGYFYTDTVF